MTDEQIVKALECCIEAKHEGDCVKLGCPYYLEEQCAKKNGKHALDLINRQKAEIEQLKKQTPIVAKSVSEIETKDVAQFKIGATVYACGFNTGDVIASKVVMVSVTEDDVWLHLDNGCIVSSNQQIGKSVFFSREEAKLELDARKQKQD